MIGGLTNVRQSYLSSFTDPLSCFTPLSIVSNFGIFLGGDHGYQDQRQDDGEDGDLVEHVHLVPAKTVMMGGMNEK